MSTSFVGSGVESEIERLQQENDRLRRRTEELEAFLSAKERRQQRDQAAHAHSDDPETSKMAALLLSGPRRWASRRKVLDILILIHKEGLGGATDDEMLTFLEGGSAYSTFRTCRTELRNLLLVRDSGLRRPSFQSKEPCVVWEIADTPEATRERFDQMVADAERARASR